MNLINIIDLYGFSIFDGIVYPDGIDRETLINTILDKCAMYIPLYTDYSLLNAKIRTFFLKNKLVFERLYTACTLEYEMIENYDRIESSTRNTNEKTNDTIVKNLTNEEQSDYSSTTHQDGSNVGYVSPYDVQSFVDDTKLVSQDDSKLNSSNTVNRKGIDSTASSKDSNMSDSLTLRAHGNIGVTTSQQMLESELAIRPKLNIYEIIANLFYTEFMLYTTGG